MLTWSSKISPAIANVVLIISDQSDVSALWKSLFEQKGCMTVQELPENALLTCKVIGPSLIVIDAHLSHADRLMLCSKLRSMSASPILLLVSEYTGSQIVDIYNAGVDECLLKPVSPAFVVVKAMSWLLRNRWIRFKADVSTTYTAL